MLTPTQDIDPTLGIRQGFPNRHSERQLKDLGSTKLDKINNLHSTASIDTEDSGTRGRSVWVHSRLLDSSVPAGEGGAVGNGVARSLGTEPG